MDLIYFTQDENIPVLVISVDFEKAVDTLELVYKLSVLPNPSHQTVERIN